MTLMVGPYILPDAFLFAGTGNGYLVWQPEAACLVLGQSENAEKSLIIENVIRDNITVTKRPTGGGAVMLTPMTIVISVAKTFPVMIHFKEFFSVINSLIIESLAGLGIQKLLHRGISDIAVGDRKILGSSMACHANRLVYHAVLNVSEDPAMFEKYLRHPGREPDYRTGRSHSDFVTSLKAEGYDFSAAELITVINVKLNGYLSGA